MIKNLVINDLKNFLVIKIKKFNRAVRMRKVLGGGMRQAGVIAAAGIYALHRASETILNDHNNAQIIAKGGFFLVDKL